MTLILTGLLVALMARRALVLENVALRHQLAVLQRTGPRPRLRPSDRLFWVLLSRLWRGWANESASRYGDRPPYAGCSRPSATSSRLIPLKLNKSST